MTPQENQAYRLVTAIAALRSLAEGEEHVMSARELEASALSALTALRTLSCASGWREMDSAPKDGTPFFAWFPSWRVTDFENWDQYVRFVGEGDHATHWHQPLPLPPEGTTREIGHLPPEGSSLEPATTDRDDARYPCADCGVLRTKAEGGTTFTVCDECWKEHYGDG